MEFARAALVSTPDWIHTLMNVRDALVRPLGLRTRVPVAAEEVTILPGHRIGPFKILWVEDDEVLLGDDDKHLRFCTSFAVRTRDGKTEGVCTTVVTYRNFAGRAYFTPIKPFHNIIVASLVGQVAL